MLAHANKLTRYANKMVAPIYWRIVPIYWRSKAGSHSTIATALEQEKLINLSNYQIINFPVCVSRLCELLIGYFSTTFQSSQLQVPINIFYFKQIKSSGALKLQSTSIQLHIDICAPSYYCCTCVFEC